MRAFSLSPDSRSTYGPSLSFLPFGAEAFDQARVRRVPVFLLISHHAEDFRDPALCMQLAERTVPVHLLPGERPDMELLCQRAGLLFSGEGALPLCALMTGSALPFLAAPLPPAGFPLDPARLYTWLAQADRRYAQNAPACAAQAAQVLQSFRHAASPRPYAPRDAAHDLTRALLAIEDTHSGGFGGVKFPFVCALRFAQHAAANGDKPLRRALARALDAMCASALFDPLDGSFFSAALTDDWRVFVPEKPLAVNAMLALILLSDGRRAEAARLLDTLLHSFSLPGGLLSPALHAPRSTYAFTPEQACAALGSEDGLRACRLLSLLKRHTRDDPPVAPSRFSPVPQDSAEHNEPAARCPVFPASPAPEDAAFLRRAMSVLLRARAARTPQQPVPTVITEHCALSAAVLAMCAARLGETRYTQSAQRAVSALAAGLTALPASVHGAGMLRAHATCGASAALALAMLTLGRQNGEYAHEGLRLLGAALHTFVREDGLVMHTAKEPFAPRVPAIYDSGLPSPAALLVHALRIADGMRPQAHYADAMQTIWAAAAPAVRAQPLDCISLIDAMNTEN